MSNAMDRLDKFVLVFMFCLAIIGNIVGMAVEVREMSRWATRLAEIRQSRATFCAELPSSAVRPEWCSKTNP